MTNGRRGRPPRHSVCCFYLTLYTVILTVSEYVIITRFVMNAPSTRLDWLIATIFIAPIVTVATILTIMIIGWIVTRFTPRGPGPN